MGEAKIKEALAAERGPEYPSTATARGGPAPSPSPLTPDQQQKIEDQRQLQMMARFTEEPAILINGVYLMVIEGMVRFNLHETVQMTVPTRVRFSGVTTPETIRKIGEAFITVADGMAEQAEEAQLKAMGGVKPEIKDESQGPQ